jgi:uncharacterized peroxidase-related enzyme
VTWISTVSYGQAKGRLKLLYDRVKGPGDNVDNIMMAHSLRPHTMDGHMALYKYVLHHSANTVPKWLLEAIGVLVSHLNGCRYCFDHHFTGMARLIGDPARAGAIREAILSGAPATAFEPAEAAALAYAAKLTTRPAEMAEADVAELRAAGWDDGQILEINQVTAYFAYANRTVQGLGVSTEGDVLGLSPNNSDDPDDWAHR